MIKRFVKGLAFGAVAGTVAGLLFAPRSGEATREKLVTDVDDATRLSLDLNNSLQNFQASLVNLKETASELLPDFQKETEQALTDFQFQADPRIEEIKRQIEKIQATIEEIG